jgi:predicted enzyme related to lactoylglutathione lyase
MGNQVIHVEVLGSDAAALQRFFGDVFGWKIDNSNPGGYGMTDHEETGIVVGIGSPPEGAPGHVTFYVRVADIDAALEKATAAGGSVIMPKFSPSPNAVLALIADPEGHVIGLSE